MLQIPLLENTGTLFMAGEELDQIWRDMGQWNRDIQRDTIAILQRYGTSCPAQGCHHCMSPDCPFADFIRHYWNHPRCD